MSDEEEESMSEGFSASEEEWKPGKDVRGGESSDDDDSDFEDSPLVGVGGNSVGAASTSAAASARKKGEPKSRSASKAASAKKRKPIGQSLRAKLYNKYRPPPKTFTSPSLGGGGSNSPSASTSRTASKNAKTPNESSEQHDNDNSSSDSSLEDYLVNPAELDFRSSFFNADGDGSAAISKETSPAPIFDCNAGLNFSDSGSEDNNDSSAEEQNTADTKAFDFRNLLEKANSLERAKETIAKRAAEAKTQAKNSSKNGTTTMDVNSLLALGEKQNHSADALVLEEKAEQEEDERDVERIERGPQKLNKTKSTRIKRHTKTRPASTVVAGDTDDSDWEEVADDANDSCQKDNNATHNDNLEIHIELPSRHRKKDNKKQQDLEMAIKRRLNRDLKERQMQLHQTSLLCMFGRSYFYNRLLNDTQLMQAALKLLPSKNVYPPERGTEIKYFQSLVTWFKTAIKLLSPNLYPEKKALKKSRVKGELLEQIKRKEASCKQDMIFIFVILMRAMGLQCRLVVNMQPLPLRPAQSDLLTIKLKSAVQAKKANVEKTEMEKIDKDKEQKEKVVVEVNQVEKKVQSKEKNKNKKESAVHLEEKTSLHAKRTTREKGEAKDGKSSNTGKHLEKEGNKEKIFENKLRQEKGSELAGNPEKETRKNIAKRTIKSSNEVMEKLKSKVRNTNKTNEADGEEDKPSSTREKSTQKRRLAANILPKNIEVSVEGSHVNPKTKISLSKTKRGQTEDSSGIALKKHPKLMKQPSLSVDFTPVAMRTRHASTDERTSSTNIEQSNNRPVVEVGSKIVIQRTKNIKTSFAAVGAATAVDNEKKFINVPRDTRSRSRSKSPKVHISPTFLQTETYKEKFPVQLIATNKQAKEKHIDKTNPSSSKVKISTVFLQKSSQNTTEPSTAPTLRVLRSRQTKSNAKTAKELKIPQLDGADDIQGKNVEKSKRRPQLTKLRKPSSRSKEDSDEDFEPSPPKKPKQAPLLPKEQNLQTKNRKVLSTDDDDSGGEKKPKKKVTAGDMWIELWADVEEEWICVDLFNGKLHSVEAIRKSATSSFAYVFAFQNDLSLKDVTARYCPHWTTTVRKSRVDKAWLDTAISNYIGHRTRRDLHEDLQLRRIHEEKPMPTAIGDFKNHPLYALERHLLKFQAIYPPDAPTLGFIRGEPVYSRDCVHTLHSREIWLKSARTVKLGEQPYKIVKARPKWDRLTQTVIKDQPLEIFGYWQTQDYEPPTAENGIVPRNAYGNVELFKECMLPKKTVHLKLSGLNRICKKLNIDCANAVIGFDFHQGVCHPMFDGFVVCEEFGDQVTAAWYQDQEEQACKDQEKYEARVYGNWKKLIRGLLIRERLKKKYNF